MLDFGWVFMIPFSDNLTTSEDWDNGGGGEAVN